MTADPHPTDTSALRALARLVVKRGVHLGTLPPGAQDDWLGADKALHFSASLAIASAGYAGASLATDDRPTRGFIGALLCVGAGLGKEVYDLQGHGTASFKDLAFDGLGCAAGLLLAIAVDRWIQVPTARPKPEPLAAAWREPPPAWLQRIFLDRLGAFDRPGRGGVVATRSRLGGQ